MSHEPAEGGLDARDASGTKGRPAVTPPARLPFSENPSSSSGASWTVAKSAVHDSGNVGMVGVSVAPGMQAENSSHWNFLEHLRGFQLFHLFAPTFEGLFDHYACSLSLRSLRLGQACS